MLWPEGSLLLDCNWLTRACQNYILCILPLPGFPAPRDGPIFNNCCAHERGVLGTMAGDPTLHNVMPFAPYVPRSIVHWLLHWQSPAYLAMHHPSLVCYSTAWVCWLQLFVHIAQFLALRLQDLANIPIFHHSFFSLQGLSIASKKIQLASI